MSDSGLEYEFRFEPVNDKIYYAYKRTDGSVFVSLISPQEWGDKYIGSKMTYLHKVKIKDGTPHIIQE